MSAWPSTSPTDGAFDGRPLQDRVVLVAGAGGGWQCRGGCAAAAGATVVLLGRKPRRLTGSMPRSRRSARNPCCTRWTWKVPAPTTTPNWPRPWRELGRLDGLLVCAAHFRG